MIIYFNNLIHGFYLCTLYTHTVLMNIHQKIIQIFIKYIHIYEGFKYILIGFLTRVKNSIIILKILQIKG